MRIGVKFFLVMEDAVLDEEIVATYRLADFCNVIAACIGGFLDNRGILVAEMENLVPVQ